MPDRPIAGSYQHVRIRPLQPQRQILIDNMPSPGRPAIVCSRRSGRRPRCCWSIAAGCRSERAARACPCWMSRMTRARSPAGRSTAGAGGANRGAVAADDRGLAAGDEFPHVGAARARPRGAGRTAILFCWTAGLRTAMSASGGRRSDSAPRATLAYAVQWFAFGVVAVVVLVVTSLRRGRGQDGRTAMTSGLAPGAARGRRSLFVLAALFFVPVVAAFWLYYGTPGWRPRGAANKGELIDPAVPLPAVEFAAPDGSRIAGDLLRDRWTMLFIGSARCDERCRDALYLTRQTRLALNKDAHRVRRVFLATGPYCCDPGLLARARRSHRGAADAVATRSADTPDPGARLGARQGRRAHLHRRPARQPDDELCCAAARTRRCSTTSSGCCDFPTSAERTCS